MSAFIRNAIPPDSRIRCALALEPEGGARSRVIAHLVHGGGFEKVSVGHHVGNGGRVAEVGQWVLGEYDQVRQFAFLNGAEFMIEADVVRAVERRGADGFERRHSTLLEHPQLPVRPEALHLAVRPEVHAHATIRQPLGRFGKRHVPVLVVRDERAAARAAIHNTTWSKRQQPLILPHIGVTVPVVLAPEAAVANDQRRCIANVCSAPN